MKKPMITAAVIAVIAAAVLYVGIHKATSTSPTPDSNASSNQQTAAPKTEQTTNTSSAAKPIAVSISNFSFDPTTLSVPVGTKVTWTNRDSMPHTVTAAPGGPMSGELAKGQSYSFTFKTAGIYHYHCSIHPGMLGTVIVGQ